MILSLNNPKINREFDNFQNFYLITKAKNKKNPEHVVRVIIHTLSMIGGYSVPASVFLSEEA